MSLSENPAERAEKYIRSFNNILQQKSVLSADTLVKGSNITRVFDAIQRYVNDAKHYLENEKPTTSLVSVAYAEGLLDALEYLELMKPSE